MDSTKISKRLPSIDCLLGTKLFLHEGKAMISMADGRSVFLDHPSYIYLAEGSLKRQIGRIIEVAGIVLRDDSTYIKYKNEKGSLECGRGYYSSKKEILAYAIGLSEIEGIVVLAYTDEMIGKSAPDMISFTPLFQIEDYIPYGRRRNMRES